MATTKCMHQEHVSTASNGFHTRYIDVAKWETVWKLWSKRESRWQGEYAMSYTFLNDEDRLLCIGWASISDEWERFVFLSLFVCDVCSRICGSLTRYHKRGYDRVCASSVAIVWKDTLRSGHTTICCCCCYFCCHSHSYGTTVCARCDGDSYFSSISSVRVSCCISVLTKGDYSASE